MLRLEGLPHVKCRETNIRYLRCRKESNYLTYSSFASFDSFNDWSYPKMKPFFIRRVVSFSYQFDILSLSFASSIVTHTIKIKNSDIQMSKRMIESNTHAFSLFWLITVAWLTKGTCVAPFSFIIWHWTILMSNVVSSFLVFFFFLLLCRSSDRIIHFFVKLNLFIIVSLYFTSAFIT